ncbi:hypothetical protein [Salinicola endophyticus]|uniref:Type IV pilus biogenesis protein PilP n=1 Tax=Salinicola endophyticus TaxID=1949083 RepID=A0AB74U8M2_9GAMM
MQLDIQSLDTDRDKAQAQQAAQKDRVDDLASRLQTLETWQKQQAVLDIPGQVEALSSRIQSLSDSTDVRFSAAQEKQQTLESQIEKVRKQRVSRKPTASRQKPSPPSPTFDITGLEQRGGRPYLVVALGKSQRLSDLTLVGEGQAVGGWMLSSIDGRSAAFTVSGKTVVLPIP